MHMNKKLTTLIERLGIILIIGALLYIFFSYDLGVYLTLDYLKASHSQFAALYNTHTLTFLAAYFGIYIIVTALSLPGATVMSLAGGALFGFWTGLVIVSFASTIGATLACFVARYIFGQSVQERFPDKLEKINQGIEREGAFYLFTLRLIPIFPFFVINLVMGLTKMPLITFYWVSQLGMLPGTVVFINAGKELGQIQSPADILSPGLLISFALLGVFPLAAKKIVTMMRSRRNQTKRLDDNNG